ncbi:hypothetical protein [Bacillus subtilis]|uniref:hypothetical protein n=2 Tax=Bacillus subtilis TaxID=1423 RepID=UPI0025C7DDF3|nr:hypothetical protein [Bacillus subtilis]GLI90615.1 hypothetical protein ANABIO4_39670 [Bacillus subtilis]
MLKFLSVIFKQRNSNPDNEAFIEALSNQLQVANKDADLMEQELDLRQSSAEWLDEWGSWFGVKRLTGETDEHYRFRILTAMEDKVTIPAIKRGVKKVMGDDTVIKIYEPFEEIRYFNVSTFSGVGRFQDGDYYRIGVIDVIINKPITEELMAFINTLKAAGISVKFTYKMTPPPDQIVIGDGDDNPDVVYENAVSNEPGFIDETNGAVFSGDNPIQRYSGDRDIWVRTTLKDTAFVSPIQVVETEKKIDR